MIKWSQGAAPAFPKKKKKLNGNFLERGLQTERINIIWNYELHQEHYMQLRFNSCSQRSEPFLRFYWMQEMGGGKTSITRVYVAFKRKQCSGGIHFLVFEDSGKK
jgi:hypothetical protein